ncbi:GMP/IMP nucleotidase [Aliikangiella marina]|uniref:GMP/IMP nucleotidase n=1 Tax=Aliikangiella marina TaxID=1712262 RepID=A0A545T9P3_9GAMM|nr:GMP/IMP nucleotidase [Aliikangiella marina]TQV73929.1 GMP/IMP nucleotidase [Aliikangiella marina]
MEPKLDWEKIDTVLLDMDGTILDLKFDNDFWLDFLPRVYAEKNNISLAESKAFLRESYGSIEGKLQWYCLDFWSERLDIDIPALKMSLKHKVAFRDGAVEFLAFLRRQNKKVFLVTNAHRKTLEIKLLNANFHEYFLHLTSSHDFGYPKEEQAYWCALNEKYPFDKSRTLFVDDSVRILESAKEYGIKYILGITSPDSSKGAQDCSPFESITDYKKFIAHV